MEGDLPKENLLEMNCQVFESLSNLALNRWYCLIQRGFHAVTGIVLGFNLFKELINLSYY